jgi:hypothetical protein
MVYLFAIKGQKRLEYNNISLQSFIMSHTGKVHAKPDNHQNLTAPKMLI